MKKLLHRILILLSLVSALILAACGRKFPQTAEIEKTIDGHRVVLTWKTGDEEPVSCLTDLSEGDTSLIRTLTPFKECTAEEVTKTLEGHKSLLTDASPDWLREALDQFIEELQRY